MAIGNDVQRAPKSPTQAARARSAETSRNQVSEGKVPWPLNRCVAATGLARAVVMGGRRVGLCCRRCLAAATISFRRRRSP